MLASLRVLAHSLHIEEVFFFFFSREADLPHLPYRPAGGGGGQCRQREDPLSISKVVQKHPVSQSSALLYTQTRRVREQWVTAISFRPPDGIDRAVNFSWWGVGRRTICLRSTHILSGPQSLFRGPPLLKSCRSCRHKRISCRWVAVKAHLVILCSVSAVLLCAGAHCYGHDADRNTYLLTHNSLLVWQACDLLNNLCVKCSKGPSFVFLLTGD